MRTSTQTPYIVIALAVLALAVPVAPASGKSVDAASGDVHALPTASQTAAHQGHGRYTQAGMYPGSVKDANRGVPAAIRQQRADVSIATAPTLVSGETDDGFDWLSAAIGAAAAMALVALCGAAFLTVRRRTAVTPSAASTS